MNGLLAILSPKEIFWLVHILVVVLCAFLLRADSKSHKLAELLIIALVPGAGLCLSLAMRCANYRFKQFGISKSAAEQLQTLLENESSKQSISTETLLNGDIVPLNDLLYLENVGDKHTLLTDAVRKAVLDDKAILKKAIRDEDREVAHYAVSMATGTLGELDKRLRSLRLQKNTHGEDVVYIREYEDCLRQYLDYGLVDKATKQALLQEYQEILQKLCELLQYQPYYLEKLVALLLDADRLEEAEAMAKAGMAANPQEEASYLLLMQIYISAKKLDALQELLETFKQSSVKFSAEGMRIVRYWSKARQ